MFLWIISILLILSGIIISYIFFKNLSINYTYQGPGTILLDKTGQVGDFIGGIVGTIFSLAGFMILIVTLSSQTQTTYIEQFENKFFELVRFHRENVSEIIVKRKSLDENEKLIEFEFSGRQAFKVILNDFITCLNELRKYFNMFSVEQIYEPGYLLDISNKINVDLTHIRLKSIARINIAYCIVFYGVGDEGYQILEKLFHNKYKPAFYKDLLDYIQMKPIVNSKYWDIWTKFKGIKKISDRIMHLKEIVILRKKNKKGDSIKNDYYYNNDYIKYYGGHQHRIGHYYRHLFQTVKYVNSQTGISFKQKYFYVKTLRAQLSTYEQTLLFINSLSILGMPWEFDAEYKKSRFEFLNRKRKKENQLITKYNLIKNVPGEHLFGIYYEHYYPNTKYEIKSTM